MIKKNPREKPAMQGIRTIKLKLLAPLIYREDRRLEPFTPGPVQGERLFIFTLDPAESRSIEPDRTKLLGDLIFGGFAEDPAYSGAETRVELPAGGYFFAQTRSFLDKEACAGLAVEVQKDGLWERYALESRLYLRYLYEDGPVTQVFRPWASG
jgi:hypothetical protein